MSSWQGNISVRLEAIKSPEFDAPGFFRKSIAFVTRLLIQHPVD
jgi:hypothetical protein